MGKKEKEVGCGLSRERREKLAFAKKKEKRAVEREVRSCLFWKNKRQTEREGGERVKGFGWKQIWQSEGRHECVNQLLIF